MVRTVCVALVIGHSTAFAGSWGKDADADWGKTSTGSVTAGKRLSVSDPIVVGDLALYPVIDREATGAPEADVTTLGPAMATGLVSVHESANGIVGEVRVVNHGDEPVLVMAGDVVHGGMQDRVVQRTELIASGAAVRVPVHCVERGRWTDRFDGTFAYAGRVDPQLRGVVEHAGSQDATWNAVAALNRARGVSETASWLAGRHLDPTVLAATERELREKFDDDKRVVGVVVARNGRFTGSEVYPDPDLFAQDRLQVLSSHLVAPPVANPMVASVPSTMDAAAFLEDQLAELD